MRTLLAVVVVLIAALAAINPASAGTIDTQIDSQGNCEMYSLYLCQPLAGKTGTFLYAADTADWGEVYGGLTYSPTTFSSFAFGIGGEEGRNDARFGGSVWLGHGKTSALWLWERDGSGPWDKVVVKYQTTPILAVGYTEKSYSGKGFYLEASLPQGTTLKYHGYREPQITIKKVLRLLVRQGRVRDHTQQPVPLRGAGLLFVLQYI